MIEVHHVATCHAPRLVTFDFIDDYRNTPRWMFGLNRFRAIGEQVRGVGTEFSGGFAVPPVNLTSTVRVTAYRHGELIEYESISGFTNSAEWHFADAGSAAVPVTEVRVVIRYDVGGGLPGRLLGRAMEPVVALAIRHSEHTLRRLVEEHWARVRAAEEPPA